VLNGFMPDKQLFTKLRADLCESLRAEHSAEGDLVREDVERIARWWMLIAVENYSLDWWDFLPGDSPEDACRAFAVEWMTEQRVQRSRARLRQVYAFWSVAQQRRQREVDAGSRV
jgi:hypothetical protein